ncbi:MAG TPA: DUF2063 domain-containing protein [Crenotrichaceae bacterium]|nr:DUF2063 domain-containing protein [Crenotrichaceae bacterium]
MPDLPVFQKKQFEFSAYIRDPQQFPAPPDVEPRRMAVYRELFFNNVEGFLASTFPVLKSLLEKNQWLALVQDYFCNNRSDSPYFTSIPEQFVDYLNSRQAGNSNPLPFMHELAHYEWVEMVLMMAEGDVLAPEKLDNNTLLSSAVRVSDLAYPLAYQFPVHQISPENQPQSSPENPTYLVVYRDDDDDVKFMEINAVTYALIESMETHPGQQCQQHLQSVIQQLNHPQPEQAFAYGVDILQGLLERSILTIVEPGKY